VGVSPGKKRAHRGEKDNAQFLPAKGLPWFKEKKGKPLLGKGEVLKRKGQEHGKRKGGKKARRQDKLQKNSLSLGRMEGKESRSGQFGKKIKFEFRRSNERTPRRQLRTGPGRQTGQFAMLMRGGTTRNPKS